jgi:DHA1 family tetracycline resistance protein-like MFS transporter
MLVGPGIFSITFAIFIASERSVKVPGAPWYLAALLLVVSSALAYAVTPGNERGGEEAVAATAGAS